jgi:hypothetical protein
MAVQYGPRVVNLMSSQETKFAPSGDESVFRDVIRYANITNRYPIYVYEPDLSNRLYKNFVEPNFKSNEIYRLKQLNSEPFTPDIKVVYVTKYYSYWDKRIPLLVSGQGMMHGGEKSLLLQRAEKVVYFATEVYNINTMKRKH